MCLFQMSAYVVLKVDEVDCTCARVLEIRVMIAEC